MNDTMIESDRQSRVSVAVAAEQKVTDSKITRNSAESSSSSSVTRLMNLFGVEGMVAVVTGGGTGLGLIMARTLAFAGAERVYILGRRLNVLESAVTEYCAESGVPLAASKLIPIQCDVRCKASLLAAVDVVSRDSGYINLLCCNAGILGVDPIVADASTPLAEWRERMMAVEMDAFTQTMHVNVTGSWFTMLAFLDLLHNGNSNNIGNGVGAATAAFGRPYSGSVVPSIQSQIILTSSLSALSRGRVARVSYSAGKAAMLHLALKASSLLAGHGIRVNTLIPGLFPSEMVNGAIQSRDPETEEPDFHSFIPCRAFGSDDHIAGSLLYLAGRAGSYCNGMTILADGGRLSAMNGNGNSIMSLA